VDHLRTVTSVALSQFVRPPCYQWVYETRNYGLTGSFAKFRKYRSNISNSEMGDTYTHMK